MSIPLHCSLSEAQRMTVYTFSLIGASVNFFFCLILFTAFCTVRHKKFNFFIPTVIIGLFVFYSWLLEAWLLTRATPDIAASDNYAYQETVTLVPRLRCGFMTRSTQTTINRDQTRQISGLVRNNWTLGRFWWI